MNCGYKLQMISRYLYLSILGDMCKHRDVVRAIGSETYTYTWNRWGEKCYTECCTRNVLYNYCYTEYCIVDPHPRERFHEMSSGVFSIFLYSVRSKFRTTVG